MVAHLQGPTELQEEDLVEPAEHLLLRTEHPVEALEVEHHPALMELQVVELQVASVEPVDLLLPHMEHLVVRAVSEAEHPPAHMELQVVP